jgi:hypothetical protein
MVRKRIVPRGSRVWLPSGLSLSYNGFVSLEAPARASRRSGSYWWLFWAAVAVWGLFASAYFHGREEQYIEENARLRQQVASATAELMDLREAAGILGGEDVTRFQSMKRAGPGAGSDILYVDRGHGMLLIAGLNAAPAGKTYEMWIVPPNRPSIPAGLFQARNDGATMHVALNSAARPEPGTEIIVTLENAGGAATPSTPALVSIRISGATLH